MLRLIRHLHSGPGPSHFKQTARREGKNGERKRMKEEKKRGRRRDKGKEKGEVSKS